MRVATMQRRFEGTIQRLHRSSSQFINTRLGPLDRASARLQALSPLAVLSRGYALIYVADGALLRSAAKTSIGQTIRAYLAAGTLEAEVTQIDLNERNATEISNS
jgi:exodeoxyribonuclease VII large subunit